MGEVGSAGCSEREEGVLSAALGSQWVWVCAPAHVLALPMSPALKQQSRWPALSLSHLPEFHRMR